jgi:predicted nucleic acid-binding protein
MASRYQHSVRTAPVKARTESSDVVADHPLDELYISTVTLAELRFGIELLSEGSDRRDALNHWLTHTIRPMFERRVLPVTEDIMLKWRIAVEEGARPDTRFRSRA